MDNRLEIASAHDYTTIRTPRFDFAGEVWRLVAFIRGEEIAYESYTVEDGIEMFKGYVTRGDWSFVLMMLRERGELR